MSYTYPTGSYGIFADVGAVDTFMRQRMSTSGVTGYGIVVSGSSPANNSTTEAAAPYDGAKGAFNQALIDSIFCARGYITQSAALGLGGATTNSTSFGDVGNGSTTGFSAWSASVAIAKTYLLLVDVGFWGTSAAGLVTFQVVVGSTNYTNASMVAYVNTLNDTKFKSFTVPVVCAAGSNTIKLQWKTDGVVTANVDGNQYRNFTMIG